MTRYINWRDVADRYPNEVAKISAGAEGVKASYIVGAEDLVDAYAAARYTTPFNSGSVPGLITDCCIDAAYLKIVIRGDPKTVKALRDSLKERLEGIRDGTLLLTVAGTIVDPMADTAWSTHKDFGSSFGVDDPTCWGVDSNWMQSFQDAR